MPRPQFTLRALLVAMLVVGAFFGGMVLQRERQRRSNEAALAAERAAMAQRPLPNVSGWSLLVLGQDPVSPQ